MNFYHQFVQEWQMQPGKNLVCLHMPNWETCGFVIQGVKPESVVGVRLRVDGICVLDIGCGLSDDGERVPAGVMMKLTEAMQGCERWQGMPMIFRSGGKALHISEKRVVQLVIEVEGHEGAGSLRVLWLQKIRMELTAR